MIFYEVDGSPLECTAEGESEEEYYTSWAAAKRRAAEMVRERLEAPEDYAFLSVQVRKLELVEMSKQKLALAILNRNGWVSKSEVLLDRCSDWFRKTSEVV